MFVYGKNKITLSHYINKTLILLIKQLNHEKDLHSFSIVNAVPDNIIRSGMASDNYSGGWFTGQQQYRQLRLHQ